MKRENLLKIMLVILMGIIMLVMATDAYALTDSNNYIDLTNSVNTNTNTNTNTNIDLNTNTNTKTNTNTNLTTNTNNNTNTNYNTNLPKAGLEENTMMGVAVVVLGIVAIFAYKKVKYYKGV